MKGFKDYIPAATLHGVGTVRKKEERKKL